MNSISKFSVVCSLLLLASSVSGQSSSSASADPLNGSSFSSGFFTPKNTYTPPTTFESATNVKPTTLIGVGPSITTNAASFSYNIPDQTVGITTNSELYSSLAKAGLPTAQGNDLSPDGQNLQLVPQGDGALRQSVGVVGVMAAAALAGAGVMFL